MKKSSIHRHIFNRHFDRISGRDFLRSQLYGVFLVEILKGFRLSNLGLGPPRRARWPLTARSTLPPTAAPRLQTRQRNIINCQRHVINGYFDTSKNSPFSRAKTLTAPLSHGRERCMAHCFQGLFRYPLCKPSIQAPPPRY